MADSRPASPYRSRTLAGPGAITVLGMVISGCALQPDYSPPSLQTPRQWTEVRSTSRSLESGSPYPDQWWTALHDPAIDRLVLAALSDSPTVDEAVARTDEARAVLRGASAQGPPSMQANASATRQQGMSAQPGETMLSSGATAGLVVSYEVDVLGRVRELVKAAESRVAARTAEVQGARLALVAQVADGVVALRACEFSRSVRALDIESRTQVLELTRRRVVAGIDARIAESRARNSLASARIEMALLTRECGRQAHALYVLTGLGGAAVRSTVLDSCDELPRDRPPSMPVSPELPLPLPATLLARHPALIAVDRDAAAAWSDIGAARAARLPRIDLGAILTGNWLRAAGSTLDFATWSLGATLTVPLLDGGAGASNVDAAEARYRAAAARLRQAVRLVVLDVEQAMAFAESSRVRMSSAEEALGAARDTFLATERRWRAGATSLFELEDARRQRAAANEVAIATARDHAQAWIALMKALGVATPPLPDSR